MVWRATRSEHVSLEPVAQQDKAEAQRNVAKKEAAAQKARGQPEEARQKAEQ